MKKFFRVLVPVLMAALLIGSIGWYLFDYDREFTRDMLLKQARYHDTHGNSRISSLFYNLAYQHSGQDQNVAIELANQYINDGNYTKAEVTLSNAINGGATVELYTALSKAYVDQDKLLDAVALLSYVSDPVLKAELDLMHPTAPEADYAPGFYSQYINVTLKSSGGAIFCTTDGDYPSYYEDRCDGPVTLPLGETRICAVSVDDSGLVSPMTFLSYTVGGVVEPAVFTDSIMESTLRDMLDSHSSKPLYTNQLWEIKEFNFPDGAAALDDLAMIPYVESLTISGKEFESLEPLSSLTKLKKLDLTGCRFPASDLAVLAALPALEDLNLTDCGLSTISELSASKSLAKLTINNNTIRNLEPLSGMAGLTELYMNHNALTTLEAIGNLGELSILDISFNSVESLEPLAGCVKLTQLSAANNMVAEIKGIDTLPLLAKLSLDYNKIFNTTPLGSITTLTDLSISNNNITEIGALSALNKLEAFDFSYNRVEALPKWPDDAAIRMIDGSHNALQSIDILKKMENITYVYMDYNALTNVDALAKCFHLVQVNVYGNEISDVSALTAHNIIVNYNPT